MTNLQPSREVFITCAVTGSGDTTGKSDKVPITPQQIADSCIGAAQAGAPLFTFMFATQKQEFPLETQSSMLKL